MLADELSGTSSGPMRWQMSDEDLLGLYLDLSRWRMELPLSARTIRNMVTAGFSKAAGTAIEARAVSYISPISRVLETFRPTTVHAASQ